MAAGLLGEAWWWALVPLVSPFKAVIFGVAAPDNDAPPRSWKESMNSTSENDTFVYIAGDLVTLAGEIDIVSAPGIEAVLEHLTGDIFLDCSRVTFIDVAGLRVLLAIHQRCADRKKRLLVLPSPCLTRLLSLLGLNSLVDVANPDVAPGRRDTACRRVVGQKRQPNRRLRAERGGRCAQRCASGVHCRPLLSDLRCGLRWHEAPRPVSARNYSVDAGLSRPSCTHKACRTDKSPPAWHHRLGRLCA